MTNFQRTLLVLFVVDCSFSSWPKISIFMKIPCVLQKGLHTVTLWFRIWYIFVSYRIDYVVWVIIKVASLLRTLFSSADFRFCVVFLVASLSQGRKWSIDLHSEWASSRVTSGNHSACTGLSVYARFRALREPSCPYSLLSTCFVLEWE